MIFSALIFSILIYKPYDSWNLTELKNVRIYWQDKINSIATVFVNIASEEIPYLEQIFGRDIPETSIVLFSDYDNMEVKFFFSPSRIFLVNLGGTRIERIFYHIKTFDDFVRKILSCAFLMRLPKVMRILPPNYLIIPDYIDAFCDYITLKDDFYNFPFYGSKEAGTIKFIEKEYGRSTVFDLFLNGKVINEDLNVYENGFLLWRKSKFQYEDLEQRSLFPLSSKYIHGIHKFGGRIVYFSDGYIKSVEGEKILQLEFPEQDFGYINGDENHIIFDAQNSKIFKIYIVSTDLKVSKVDLGNTRAWYPDISSDMIVFVKKNMDYDELCILKIRDIGIRKYDCLLKTDKFSEIFTPDISPDGSKVVFTIRRQNGFFDLALFQIETGELEFINQDKFIDIFPKWTDDGKGIIFSSNRTGPFNLFFYDSDSREFSRVTQNNEGAFLGILQSQKIYAIVYENFSLSLKDFDFNQYEKFSQKRDSIYLRFYNDIESEKLSFRIDDFGLLVPYIYTSLPGFFIGRFTFYFVDDLFRNNIYLGFDWKLPFYRWNLNSPENAQAYLSTSKFGFFIRGLFRSLNPYVFLRFSYEPFSGIFVRIIDRGYEFIPEKTFSSSIFLIHPLRKVLIFWGFEILDHKLYFDLPSSDFWNMVKEEYINFGQGFFINPTVGLLLRSARKSFHLENGVDFFTSSEFITRKLGVISKMSLNLFSPRVSFIIFNLGLNGFVSSVVPGRFYELFGSKEIPPYIDPPYDLSPIRNFSPLSFDFKYLGYDVGNLRGVKVRRSRVGFVGNIRAYVNVLSFDFISPFDIDFVNFVPFFSFGGFERVSDNFDFIQSYGGEVDVQINIFYSLPLTIKLGLARGEITELYFALFLTPGSLRD